MTDVLVGIHQQYQGTVDLTTVQDTLTEYPLTAVTREFNANPIDPQNLIPKVENACREVWDAGLTATWSVKPKPADVANGKWRPFFEQLASYIKSQGLEDKFILVIWHEPENDIPKWFKDAAAFVAMFNKVHGWVKGVSQGILTMHAALGYRYRDKGEISDAEAPKWKTKADLNALDLYQGRSFPLAQILPENSAFKRWHKFIVGGVGNLWSVSERGFIADPEDPEALDVRADTIEREAEWFVESDIGRQCVVIILWDTIGAEGDQALPIRDQRGQAAVRYLMNLVTQEPEPEEPEEPEPLPTTDCPLCHGSGQVVRGQTITIVKVV